jgi:hypothetical protein
MNEDTVAPSEDKPTYLKPTPDHYEDGIPVFKPTFIEFSDFQQVCMFEERYNDDSRYGY